MKDKSYFRESTTLDNFEKINIIWKPFDYGRLSYLFLANSNYLEEKVAIERYFVRDIKMLQQTVLEWSDELNNLILEFLESIYPDKK